MAVIRSESGVDVNVTRFGICVLHAGGPNPIEIAAIARSIGAVPSLALTPFAVELTQRGQGFR